MPEIETVLMFFLRKLLWLNDVAPGEQFDATVSILPGASFGVRKIIFHDGCRKIVATVATHENVGEFAELWVQNQVW